MPTFMSQGVSLHYRDLGAGPILVLIHGWGASGREWDAAGWVDALAGRRLLIPDVRGHGGSEAPHDSSAYRMELLAGDILALLEATGVDEADVFGYSMGGAIALWTAYTSPSSVRSLVAGAMSGSDPEQARQMGRQLRGEASMDSRAEKYRAYALSTGATDLEALAACLDAGLACPRCEDLAVYGGEALLIAGDHDRRAAFTEDVAGCLPGGQFQLFPGVDHMGAFADPRVMAAVQAFLSETSPI